MLSFHVKFVWTDRQTDRRTMVKQHAPNLSIRGHQNRNSFWDGWKTLQAMEKTLVTSIFSFSHHVFKSLLSQGRQKSGLCGKELTNRY